MQVSETMRSNPAPARPRPRCSPVVRLRSPLLRLDRGSPESWVCSPSPNVRARDGLTRSSPLFLLPTLSPPPRSEDDTVGDLKKLVAAQTGKEKPRAQFPAVAMPRPSSDH